MVDDGPVVDEQDRVRPDPGEPDAELRLLPAERLPPAVPADAECETPGEAEGGAAERGVPAQHVAHPRPPGRMPPVGAADHPVELLGEPPRPPPRLPPRLGPPAHGEDPGVGVPGGEVAQPVGIRDGVVVEEGDPLAPGRADAGVAPGGEAARPGVGHHPHLRRAVREPVLQTLQQHRVVVDHQQDLQRRQ
ncbi:hypothetical protein Sgou_44880 [Streptomyces gougerotii]|uniref:Uncharacterized protein n=1 Tax=Streptomyces gougerotii TaxID=53448 RepID=A0ABQ1DBC1_9ACTN|nr:hypothetical protein Sgou_44880 [Streptomyces gougerotii]